MNYSNKHFLKTDFESYYKLSRKDNLSDDELEAKLNFERHLNECPKCSSEYFLLKSAYFNENDKYRKRSKIRTVSLLTVSSVILAYLVINPGQKLTKKIPGEEEQIFANDDNNIAEHADTVILGNNDADTSYNKKGYRYNSEDINNIFTEFLKRSDSVDLYTFAKVNNIALPESFKDDYVQEIQLEELNVREVSEVKILSPMNKKALSMPITFRWEKTEGKITIVIKDNMNKKIFEKSSINSSGITFNKESKPGVYYWDFRINDRIKTKRKFYVF